MDRFYVITNSGKDHELETTRQICEYLRARGKTCTIQEYQPENEASNGDEEGYRYTDPARIPEGTECILVLGGDGTLIQAARDTVNRKIPLLGVNLGTLGFLAEIEKTNVNEALDSLILDNYTIEPRMMLEGTVCRRGVPRVHNLALNDIVVNRAGALRVIDYEIIVNGQPLNTYTADGMIIATPTGSTGYSLSAGGPIISPVASMIVATPICPHTLAARSIVLSGSDHVRIRIGAGRRHDQEKAYATFDGEVCVPMQTGDYVDIRKSDKTTDILKISRMSFLEVLRNKMQAN